MESKKKLKTRIAEGTKGFEKENADTLVFNLMAGRMT